MDNLTVLIAKNLKKYREDRKLSLDNVAKLTGVSKSMLAQIERGEVNPTVSTVWKIANGLKISFTQLMTRPEVDIEIITKNEIEPLIEDNGRIRNYPIFPFDGERGFELYSVEIDPGGTLNAEAHPIGTQEFITVLSGELTMIINNENFIVPNGDSIRFKSDTAHTYKNLAEHICIVSMVIYYPH